jgi:hypothetical protein
MIELPEPDCGVHYTATQLQAYGEAMRVDGDIIINRLSAENNRLHMELDAARADAGRYQYIRKESEPAYEDMNAFDQGIDAAIKQQGATP